MTLPKRILVVDDDPGICDLLCCILTAPEFDVRAYRDPASALADLPQLRPDLVICDVVMPGMDGRAFLERVRQSPDLSDVAFILISGMTSEEEIAASFSLGADDFVTKPFHPGRFAAKVRATLRLVERRRSDALAGEVGEGGTLALLRFCEERRLTGRLTVRSGPTERWAEFEGGDLTSTGGNPLTPGEDAFDALLGMTAGQYVVEQRPLEASALRAVGGRPRGTEGGAAAPSGPVSVIPTGRLSRVEVGGEQVAVQTESENRPNFCVTTVVARGGQVLRKIEKSWSHPLKRREDQALARAQIDRQHERVLATLRNLPADARPTPRAEVPPSTLACALSFVADQARLHIGSVMVSALLRSARRSELARHPVLRHFAVAPEGRITPESPPDAVSEDETVGAMAAWTAAFLRAAEGMMERAQAVPVRQVTHMLEEDLERCDFYSWVERLATRLSFDDKDK